MGATEIAVCLKDRPYSLTGELKISDRLGDIGRDEIDSGWSGRQAHRQELGADWESSSELSGGQFAVSES